jgi:predicted TIM-barrel fold metal-dependent hydrolase
MRVSLTFKTIIPVDTRAKGARSMPRKGFAVFDADSHIIESRELWEKYLEPEYRVAGRLALWREEGKLGSYLKINGEVFRDIENPNIPSYAIWRPGMTWESVGELDPKLAHPANEGASEPLARLRDMDAMGVDQTLLYPTWFAEGFPLVKDPDVAYALARTYNNWIADFCSAAPDRLFAAAMIPLQNMDFALEELQRIVQLPCFSAVFIRPAFVEGRYLNHPYYEPLWEQLQNLGVTAAVHPTPGLWNPEGTSHGPFVEKIKGRLSEVSFLGAAGRGPFAGGGSTDFFVPGIQLGHAVSPILSYWLDNYLFVASTLLGFSVMERYPRLKLVVAHGKATWMNEVLEKMEASVKTTPLMRFYPVSTDPEEVWKQGRVMLGFDADELGIQRLPHHYVDKIIWGSRYPHQDTTSAWDAIASLREAHVDEATIARMLGRNAAEQFGIRLLQKTGA